MTCLKRHGLKVLEIAEDERSMHTACAFELKRETTLLTPVPLSEQGEAISNRLVCHVAPSQTVFSRWT